MITYLHPAYFIASVFVSNPSLKSIEFSKLRVIRDNVTKKLHTHGLAIEWTRSSVIDDLKANPSFFEIHDSFVCWKNSNPREWKYIEYMNYDECVLTDKLIKDLKGVLAV